MQRESGCGGRIVVNLKVPLELDVSAGTSVADNSPRSIERQLRALGNSGTPPSERAVRN